MVWSLVLGVIACMATLAGQWVEAALTLTAALALAAITPLGEG